MLIYIPFLLTLIVAQTIHTAENIEQQISPETAVVFEEPFKDFDPYAENNSEVAHTSNSPTGSEKSVTKKGKLSSFCKNNICWSCTHEAITQQEGGKIDLDLCKINSRHALQHEIEKEHPYKLNLTTFYCLKENAQCAYEKSDDIYCLMNHIRQDHNNKRKESTESIYCYFCINNDLYSQKSLLDQNYLVDSHIHKIGITKHKTSLALIENFYCKLYCKTSTSIRQGILHHLKATHGLGKIIRSPQENELSIPSPNNTKNMFAKRKAEQMALKNDSEEESSSDTEWERPTKIQKNTATKENVTFLQNSSAEITFSNHTDNNIKTIYTPLATYYDIYRKEAEEENMQENLEITPEVEQFVDNQLKDIALNHTVPQTALLISKNSVETQAQDPIYASTPQKNIPIVGDQYMAFSLIKGPCIIQ